MPLARRMRPTKAITYQKIASAITVALTTHTSISTTSGTRGSTSPAATARSRVSAA